MPGVFDALHNLQAAIQSALDMIPEPQRPAYESWVREELDRLRLEIAKRAKI